MDSQNIETVIIGAGLTGLTTAFHLSQKERAFKILEVSDHIGGQIRTFQEGDFVFESGPNTGVVSFPEVAELFEALDSDCELETAREESKRRLIWKGNSFHPLPNNLLRAIFTPLFTLYDKFRVLGEPFRAKGTDCNESVGALAERRLGKSFLKYAVDPFLSGVYAGDPMKLITRYALPKLYELENQYGSFVKGSIAKAKIKKTERELLASKKVFSARGGLSHLIAAMEKDLGEENIILRAKDITIQPDENGWLIQYTTPEGSKCIRAKKVVTTVGAYALPKMLPFVGEEDLNKLSNLRYASVIQVSVGVLDTGTLKFPAFGGLVPSCEQKEVLGILFPSSCFHDRAPEDGALFSFFLGGVKHESLFTRSDEEIKALVLREFRSMLKFPATQEPDLIRIFRHEHAIPQYELSSGERFSTIERLEKQWKGLYLAGNMKGGIGMAHRILQATQLAKKLKEL